MSPIIGQLVERTRRRQVVSIRRNACLLAVLVGWPSGVASSQAILGASKPAFGAPIAASAERQFFEVGKSADGRAAFRSCFGVGAVQARDGELVLSLLSEETRRASRLRLRLGEEAEFAGAKSSGSMFHVIEGSSEGAEPRSAAGYRALRVRDATGDWDLQLEGRGAELRWTAHASGAAGRLDSPITVTGADTIELLGSGGLRFRTATGDLVWSAPRVTLSSRARAGAERGRWVEQAGGFVARAANGGSLDSMQLEWSTYFGGSGSEGFRDLCVGADGAVTAVGFSLSNDLPTTPGVFDPTPGLSPYNGFVARFSGDSGELLYATYIGGHGDDDEVFTVYALDDGSVVLGGETYSESFPVTDGAFDTQPDPGFSDGFVSRLSADGSALIFSTYLGGDLVTTPDLYSGIDLIRALTVDSQGCIVVAGETKALNFPATAGSFQTNLNPEQNSQDAFVARLSGDGAELLHATYLGGPVVDWLTGLAILPDDSVVVVGETNSAAFPTTPGAFDETYNGGRDGFIARLSPDLSTLIFGTYLGGAARDQPRDVAIHPDGSIVVVGEVESKITFGEDYDFPVTPDAWDPIGNGGADGFLCYFDPLGTELRYSTFFGGSGREELPMALAIDSAGSVTVACGTFSFDAPVTPGALQLNKLTPQNNQTGYLARFRPNHQLLYGTYLGGTGLEITLGLTSIGLDVTALGDVFLAQGTTSTDFPLTELGAFPEHAGGVDGFLTKLTMLPAGVTRYGDSTPGPQGKLAVSVLGMPSLGSDGFGWSCTSAPPDADGWLLLSAAPLTSPVALAGAQLWVDPTRLLALARVRSNEFGYFERRVPLPVAPELVGLEVFAQFVWPTPEAQAAATAALRVALQR